MPVPTANIIHNLQGFQQCHTPNNVALVRHICIPWSRWELVRQWDRALLCKFQSQTTRFCPVENCQSPSCVRRIAKKHICINLLAWQVWVMNTQRAINDKSHPSEGCPLHRSHSDNNSTFIFQFRECYIMFRCTHPCTRTQRFKIQNWNGSQKFRRGFWCSSQSTSGNS